MKKPLPMGFKIAVIRPARITDYGKMVGRQRADRDGWISWLRGCLQSKERRQKELHDHLIIDSCLGHRRCHLDLCGLRDGRCHFNGLHGLVVAGNIAK